MARIVALLRGVNIGKRQLPMAGLRSGLEAAGCTDVATYVQSGNVVLTPPTGAGKDIAGWLGDVIGELAGFAVPVVVRTKAQMAKVVAANPYPHAGGTTLHVIFCSHEAARSHQPTSMPSPPSTPPSSAATSTSTCRTAWVVRRCRRSWRRSSSAPASSAQRGTGTPSSSCCSML